MSAFAADARRRRDGRSPAAPAIAPRDRTIEALAPLFEKTIDGFGEAFRRLSLGSDRPARDPLARGRRRDRRAAWSSRCPGSLKAVRLGVEQLLAPTLAHAVALAVGPRRAPRRARARRSTADDHLRRGARAPARLRAPLGAERVSLDDAAGRVLAEDLVAPAPMPAVRLQRDGRLRGRRARSRRRRPWALPVVGESAAGGELPVRSRPARRAASSRARALPDGADAVVMQEHVERDGRRSRARCRARPAGASRAPRAGTISPQGAVALARGARLTPGPRRARRRARSRRSSWWRAGPVVTILCSGDELRSPGRARPRPARIPESNGYFVAAAARAAGAIARVAPFVRDEPEAARRAVADGPPRQRSGGHRGRRQRRRSRRDPARARGRGRGARLLEVNIKPGKPLAVGRAGAVQVLGLPGNPASASLTFLLFGVPLLRALQGDAAPAAARASAPLADSLRGRRAARSSCARGWRSQGGELGVRVLPNQASGAVTSFAEAEALAVVAPEVACVAEGDVLEGGMRSATCRLRGSRAPTAPSPCDDRGRGCADWHIRIPVSRAQSAPCAGLPLAVRVPQLERGLTLIDFPSNIPHFLRVVRALAKVSGTALAVSAAAAGAFACGAQVDVGASAASGGGGGSGGYTGHPMGSAVMYPDGGYDGAPVGTAPYDGGPIGKVAIDRGYDGGPVGDEAFPDASYDGGPVGTAPFDAGGPDGS